MPRQQKVEQVELLTKKLKSAKVAVLTDYRGLTVSQLQDLLKGPVAIAFGYGDLSAPAKVLGEFTRQTRIRLEIVGGLVEGRVMAPDQVRQTADLPSREVLLAQMLGTMQSPVAQLVATIQAPLQQIVGVLEAYREKLEGGPQAA